MFICIVLSVFILILESGYEIAQDIVRARQPPKPFVLRWWRWR